MTTIMSLFGSTKNIIIAFIAMFFGGYVLKQKYTAYKAEDELKAVETKIAKTNVIVAKKIASAKAQSKELETDTEIKVLKELKEEKTEILKKMDDIEKLIYTTETNKKINIEL